MSPSRRSSPRDWIKEEHNIPHKVKARTLYGTLIESHPVPAGTDLRKLLIETLAKWNAAGWRIETFRESSNLFFCSKDNQRICVGIERDDHPPPHPKWSWRRDDE